MRQIGIIGGMGPLATADLYKKMIDLTPATCDQEHLHIIIDSYAQIEDRTKFIMGEGANPLPKLVESAKRLKQVGCEALLMPCNTAHFFANDIEEQADVKILHIAKAAVAAIRKQYPNAKDIAVIATSGTKKARVYDTILDEYELNSVEFSTQRQQGLMDCIYKGVKAGKTQEFVPIFNKIISEIKADVYIAACTEIPMFLPFLDKDYNFIDATLELAKVGVEFGLERKIF